MRLFVVFTILLFWSQQPAPSPKKISKPEQKQPATSQQPATTDQRGTEQSPLIVKTLPSTKTAEETTQEADDRNEKSANDRHILWLTGALVVVGFLQFAVYAYQAKKLRETVKSAGEQSEAMERHIGEAARGATAMEAIGKKIDDGNQMIMRAYLVVTLGGAIYQERREPGMSDLKFEARPNLVNTGATPARDVRIKIKTDILPVPIPDDFSYPLPVDPVKPSFGGILGAHQTNTMFGALDGFVPDDEVAEIKQGTTKALCVWGVVTYKDIFGAAHSTKFGQIITWQPDNRVFVYFIAGQNDAD
jgi:hypothetical protein